jgi:SEC-C motif-containing protein
MTDTAHPLRCPCMSGLPYEECCGSFHRGVALAPTAERLMRSRYSAFAIGDPLYLLETWHPSTRPAVLELDAGQRWYRLDILARTGGGMLDSRGTVEFRASYRKDGSAGEQHEVSRFVREGRSWLYLAAV